MEILTYRNLDFKDGLLPLMDNAFRWTFNERTFEDSVKKDPRFKDSPIGFCALEKDSIVGFVGVMDLPTRTLDGNVEVIGGLYGVATLPSHVRKGISTVLMNSAHQHFSEKGYDFSVLWTSKSLVAHSLYEKLGYTDILECPNVYKVLKRKRPKPIGKKARKLDLDKTLSVYNRYVTGKTGFVVRSVASLKAMKKAERLTAKQNILGDEGYLFFEKERNGMWIRELIALNTRAMRRLLRFAEREAQDLIYDRAVFDGKLLQIYESQGFNVQRRSHTVMMVKPLGAYASFEKAYGDKIYLTSLDMF